MKQQHKNSGFQPKHQNRSEWSNRPQNWRTHQNNQNRLPPPDFQGVHPTRQGRGGFQDRGMGRGDRRSRDYSEFRRPRDDRSRMNSQRSDEWQNQRPPWHNSRHESRPSYQREPYYSSRHTSSSNVSHRTSGPAPDLRYSQEGKKPAEQSQGGPGPRNHASDNPKSIMKQEVVDISTPLSIQKKRGFGSPECISIDTSGHKEDNAWSHSSKNTPCKEGGLLPTFDEAFRSRIQIEKSPLIARPPRQQDAKVMTLDEENGLAVVEDSNQSVIICEPEPQKDAGKKRPDSTTDRGFEGILQQASLDPSSQKASLDFGSDDQQNTELSQIQHTTQLLQQVHFSNNPKIEGDFIKHRYRSQANLKKRHTREVCSKLIQELQEQINQQELQQRAIRFEQERQERQASQGSRLKEEEIDPALYEEMGLEIRSQIKQQEERISSEIKATTQKIREEYIEDATSSSAMLGKAINVSTKVANRVVVDTPENVETVSQILYDRKAEYEGVLNQFNKQIPNFSTICDYRLQENTGNIYGANLRQALKHSTKSAMPYQDTLNVDLELTQEQRSNLERLNQILLPLKVDYDFKPKNQLNMKLFQLSFAFKYDKIKSFIRTERARIFKRTAKTISEYRRARVEWKTQASKDIKESFELINKAYPAANEFYKTLTPVQISNIEDNLKPENPDPKLSPNRVSPMQSMTQASDPGMNEHQVFTNERFYENKVDMHPKITTRFNPYTMQPVWWSFEDENIEQRRVYDMADAEQRYLRAQPWSVEQIKVFVQKFLAYRLDFAKISAFYANKPVSHLVNLYYVLQKPFKLNKLLARISDMSEDRLDAILKASADLVTEWFAVRDCHGSALTSFVDIQNLEDIIAQIRARQGQKYKHVPRPKKDFDYLKEDITNKLAQREREIEELKANGNYIQDEMESGLKILDHAKEISQELESNSTEFSPKPAAGVIQQSELGRKMAEDRAGRAGPAQANYVLTTVEPMVPSHLFKMKAASEALNYGSESAMKPDLEKQFQETVAEHERDLRRLRREEERLKKKDQKKQNPKKKKHKHKSATKGTKSKTKGSAKKPSCQKTPSGKVKEQTDGANSHDADFAFNDDQYSEEDPSDKSGDEEFQTPAKSAKKHKQSKKKEEDPSPSKFTKAGLPRQKAKPQAICVWTDKERESYPKYLKKFGRDFEAISAKFKDKSAQQCKNFFTNNVKKMNLSALLPPDDPYLKNMKGSLSQRNSTFKEEAADLPPQKDEWSSGDEKLEVKKASKKGKQVAIKKPEVEQPLPPKKKKGGKPTASKQALKAPEPAPAPPQRDKAEKQDRQPERQPSDKYKGKKVSSSKPPTLGKRQPETTLEDLIDLTSAKPLPVEHNSQASFPTKRDSFEATLDDVEFSDRRQQLKKKKRDLKSSQASQLQSQGSVFDMDAMDPLKRVSRTSK